VSTAPRIAAPSNATLRIAALFVSYNSGEYLPRAIHSLFAQRIGGKPAEFEVVVVDNASPARERDRPILEALARDHGVKLVWHGENVGYGGGMNLALSHTKAPIVLAANPDLLFSEGCVERCLAALLSSEKVGLVGPRGYLDEGKSLVLPVNQLPTLDDEAIRFRGRFRRSVAAAYALRGAREMEALDRATAPVAVGMLSGACLMARRATLARHGFFDPRFPLFYEDSDLCHRLEELGLERLYVPAAHIVHFVSRSVASAPRSDDPMKRWAVARRRYFQKWYGAAGPALLDRLDPAIARFGRLGGKTPHDCQDLGEVREIPNFHFTRAATRALVQVGLDSGFYLCASAAVSGDRWAFPAGCWPFFSTGARVFARAVDVADGSILGAWTFRGKTP
jgi:GT2 family glycosyltransferase